MSFGDLSTAAGVASLNAHLADKSYVDGFNPSSADNDCFAKVGGAKASDLAANVNVLRWFAHMASFTADERAKFAASKGAAAAPKAADDDDLDLFGDDDEDDAEEFKKQAAAAKAKATKKKPPARSSVLLDVKPWDDTTDMEELTKLVLALKINGLTWGAHKLVDVAFGVKKLQVLCTIVDDECSTDEIEEQICGLEDHVQSMDIAAFNKV